jgi:Type VI secretion system/phage-baseplate injector OB domain
MGEVLPSVYRAVVVETEDPLGIGRVKLVVPDVSGDNPTDWAQVVQMVGMLTRMESGLASGDDVLVAFEAGNPSRPYVLGSLWSEHDRPPHRAGGEDSD